MSVKITELDTAQILNNEDLLAGVDVSEDKTVKVFFSDFKSFVVGGVQTQVNQLSDDLQQAIQDIASDFTNYYTKSETYTKQEVNNLVDVIPRFAIEVVNTLPTQDISDTTIYLVPSEDPETNNVRDEYIYVNNSWELIGSTKVDLSNYYTKSEIDDIVSSIDTNIDNLQDSINDIDVGVKTANGVSPDTNGDLKLKTINNNSILGEGDIHISGGSGGSSELIMVTEEPTEDTKLYIEDYDIDTGDVVHEELPVGTILDFDEDSNIPVGWEEVDDSDITIKTYTDNGIDFTFTRIGNVVQLVISGTTTETITAANNYEFSIDSMFVPPRGLSSNILIGEGNPGQSMIVYIRDQETNQVLYRTRVNLPVPFYPRASITYLVY